MAKRKKNTRDTRIIRQGHIKCPNCGYVSVIPRESKKFKSKNHLKNFYCPKCKSYQKHHELNKYDSYRFKKLNGSIASIKVFRDKRRTEITILTFNIYFRVWNELESSLVNQSIILNSDYNLMETFLLNYLEEDEFRKEINDYYKKEDDISLPNEISLKFNIAESIYERFKAKCEESDLKCEQVLNYILEYVYINDIELDTNR